MLANQQLAVIAAAAVGIMLGWVVAAVAFVPHALWVLFATPLLLAVCAAAGAGLAIGGLLLAADAWFYGRWTVSITCPDKEGQCACANISFHMAHVLRVAAHKDQRVVVQLSRLTTTLSLIAGVIVELRQVQRRWRWAERAVRRRGPAVLSAQRSAGLQLGAAAGAGPAAAGGPAAPVLPDTIRRDMACRQRKAAQLSI